MKLHSYVFILTTFTSQVVYAGSPTSETIECPVGGEAFEITGTASCSSNGRYMSMRTQSSCDFVTKIPICPTNGLPVYRDFSDEELEDLAAFIKTPEFAAMRDKSPHQVAYGVAHHLGESLSTTGFSLTLGAWWFEGAAFLANPRIQDSFLREAEAELDRANAADAPIIAGLTAFAMAHAERDDFARKWLSEAKKRQGVNQYANAYIDAVSACLSDVTAEGCSPYDRFEP